VNNPSHNQPRREIASARRHRPAGSNQAVRNTVGTVKIKAFMSRGEIESRFHLPMTVPVADPAVDATAVQ